MNKRFYMLAVIMFATFLFGFIHAQVKTNPVNTGLAFSPANSQHVNIRYARGISSKMLRNFQRSFPTIFDEAWYENEFAFIAKFSSNAIATMVGYSKKGSWYFTIRRYQEKDLPKQVRSLVKSVYYDFKITGVDEVKVPQIPNLVYILHLRDGYHLKTVRVNDSELHVIAEFHE